MICSAVCLVRYMVRYMVESDQALTTTRSLSQSSIPNLKEPGLSGSTGQASLLPSRP
jgi:hypothetical protein